MRKERNFFTAYATPPNNSLLAIRGESCLSERCVMDSCTTKAMWAIGMAQTKA